MMGYCPNCQRGFREPADEQGDHGCPRCGPGEEDIEPAECVTCGEAAQWWFDSLPYCDEHFAEKNRGVRVSR